MCSSQATPDLNEGKVKENFQDGFTIFYVLNWRIVTFIIHYIKGGLPLFFYIAETDCLAGILKEHWQAITHFWSGRDDLSEPVLQFSNWGNWKFLTVPQNDCMLYRTEQVTHANQCCSGRGRRHGSGNWKPEESLDTAKQREIELCWTETRYGHRDPSQMSSFYSYQRQWTLKKRSWWKVKVQDETNAVSGWHVKLLHRYPNLLMQVFDILTTINSSKNIGLIPHLFLTKHMPCNYSE